MRKVAWLVVAFSGLSLAGCGGGGGGSGGGTSGTAWLSGRVIARDGTTADLAGLLVTLGSTGATRSTDATGSFDFGGVPAGTVTLRFRDFGAVRAAQAVARSEGSAEEDDAEEAEGGDDDGDAFDDDFDDDGDDDDVGDDDLDVVGVEDGEEVQVEVEVSGGVIVAARVARSVGGGLDAESRLEVAETSDDPDLAGKVEIESEDGGQELEVEAEHLDAGREVEAFVVCDGDEESLGTRTADLEGEAQWKVSTGDGGVLPLGASTVDDLAGCVVEVRDAGDGTVLLRGTIEDLPGAVDGEPGDEGDEAESEGRALLVAGPLALGEARIEAKRSEDDDEVDESLEVEVEGEAPGLALELWVADASAAMVLAGSFDADEEGRGEIEFETEDGGTLPAGASSILDLVGRAVEVRAASDGAVLYSGTVPALVGD